MYFRFLSPHVLCLIVQLYCYQDEGLVVCAYEFLPYSKIVSLNILVHVGSVLLDIHDGSDLFLILEQILLGISSLHEAQERQ